MKHIANLLAVPLVLALGVLLALPGTASAHNDEATLSVESQQDAGPLALDLRISARYSNDDELVESITLSVTGTGPGGETLAATPLTAVPDTVGLYGAELAFPVGGAWSLQVTGTDPAGELTASVQIAEAEASTATTEAAGPEATTAEQAIGGEDGDVVDDDPDLLPIVGGVLAVLVIGGAVVALVLRRRKAQGIDDAL
jgi:hypothetical protein